MNFRQTVNVYICFTILNKCFVLIIDYWPGFQFVASAVVKFIFIVISNSIQMSHKHIYLYVTVNLYSQVKVYFHRHDR